MNKKVIVSLLRKLIVVIMIFVVFVFPCYLYLFQENAPKVADDVTLLYNIQYGIADGTALKMNIYKPKNASQNPMPAILWLHGGGWESGSKDDLSDVFSYVAQQGYILASVEYRFCDKYKFPAQIEDCKCAVRFLRAKAAEYHINPDKIGVWGASAGGHLSMLMGTTEGIKELEGKGGWQEFPSNVQAVCSWSGVSDFVSVHGKLVELIGNLIGSPYSKAASVWKKASPIEYVHRGLPPFMLVHGKKDDLVPYNQSVRLFDSLKKSNVDVTINLIENAGHSFDDPNILLKSLEFFDKHLKNK